MMKIYTVVLPPELMDRLVQSWESLTSSADNFEDDLIYKALVKAASK